jgi:hypothetical protein
MNSQFDPVLGIRDASAILEPAYAANLGAPPGPEKLVAVIVNHGMGQQVPYETIDAVAQAVQRGIDRTNGAATVTAPPVIRRVRLGIEDKKDETELVRVEIQVCRGQETFGVHIYESYWAPLTESKVSLKDVMAFLFDAGWNGFWNSNAKKGYQRWMFGKERSFSLPKLWLMVVLTLLLGLLAALVVMNGVLAAASASHAIGGSSKFPDAKQIGPLTSDFIVADIAAVFIFIPTVALPWFQKHVIRRVGTPAWLSWIGWALIITAAVLILLAGLAIALHLAGYYPGNCLRRLWPCLWPHLWPTQLADWLVAGHDNLVTFLWGLELAAAYGARWCLIEFVGDVAAYIAAHTVSKFYDLRQQIWQAAMRVSGAVYRAQSVAPEGTKKPEFLYRKILMVGHSLGSVIGYDVLNGLLLEDEFSKDPLQVAARTRMFLTFGSPLDKTAFLFRTQADMCSPVREVAATAVQPMIQDYRHRPEEWVNLYSNSDIISGDLDFYDPPNKHNAKDKTPFHAVATAPKVHERAVKNKPDPDARTPLTAHVEYWGGNLFADELVRGITT